MSKKVFALLGVMALLVALLPAAALAAPKLPDYKPVDVGPELRTWEATPQRIQGELTAQEIDALEAEAMAAASSTPYTDCILDAKLWLSLDNYFGQYFFTTFYLVAETSGSELWVQANLSWPAGDPRPTPMVTCEQAAYLLDEFDNNMYPVENRILWYARLSRWYQLAVGGLGICTPWVLLLTKVAVR
jgi:immune inhibitor A